MCGIRYNWKNACPMSQCGQRSPLKNRYGEGAWPRPDEDDDGYGEGSSDVAEDSLFLGTLTRRTGHGNGKGKTGTYLNGHVRWQRLRHGGTEHDARPFALRGPRSQRACCPAAATGLRLDGRPAHALEGSRVGQEAEELA